MKRPYLKYHTDELEQLFENSQNDKKAIQNIIEELKHRERPKAKDLLKRVQDYFSSRPEPTDGDVSKDSKKTPPPGEKESAFEASNEQSAWSEEKAKAEPQFSHDFHLVEPIGKAHGHPQKRIFPLREDIPDLPSDEKINLRYAKALDILIDEMKKKKEGKRQIPLEDGIAVSLDEKKNGYRFLYEDTADLFEGASVTAIIGGKETPGHIVAVMQGSLIISLEEDFGDQIRTCVLLVDNTAMLKALSERLKDIGKGEGVQFNHVLAEGAVGNKDGKTNLSSSGIIELSGGLNKPQREALGMALSHRISYIWGPPGTGKTKVLTALISVLFEQGKRVLICSNTNQAVDQVLLKLCQAMGVSHPALDDGKVIRIGRIAHEELSQEWSSYVTVPGVVDRKSIKLLERKKDLESQAAQLKEKIQSIVGLLLIHDDIDIAKKKELQLVSGTELARQKVIKLEHALRDLNERDKTLSNELSKRKYSGWIGGFFQRPEEKILRDRQEVKQQKEKTQDQISSAKRDFTDASDTQQQILDEIRKLEQRIPAGSGSRSHLEREKKRVEDILQPFLTEISEINKQLADMELAIVQGARIIGATVTKTYLSPKQFVGFDVVLVDEASMVLLPALYYAAGLAGERVVISGDFRQLLPIVQTEQRVLHELIGCDVFTAAGITKAVETRETPSNLVMLDTQYRMQKPICDLISSTMYGNCLKTQRNLVDLGNGPPEPFDKILTVVDTSRIWPFLNRDAFDGRYNLMHALAIRNLCLHLHEQGFIQNAGDVGVATPYSTQAFVVQFFTCYSCNPAIYFGGLNSVPICLQLAGTIKIQLKVMRG